MKCPDRETLARLLDGEPVSSKEVLLSHIRECRRCQGIVNDDDALGALMSAFFRSHGKDMVRETISCPGAEEIAEYVEGRVPTYRRMQLMRHFCVCPSCARATLDSACSMEEAAKNPPSDVVREARAVYRRGEKIK